MSFSFNNPLIIGDINKETKTDIAQIKQDIGDLSQLDTADKSSLVNALNEAMDSTLNGASRDLDNLSDSGNDKLRSLNAYANEGELLQDADGLSFVKTYAHSTFDASKFTVVGSPNITDDGIASGFSSSNYLQTFSNSISNNYNTFEFNFKVKYSSISGTVYTIGASSGQTFIFGITNGKFIIICGTGNAWIEGLNPAYGTYNVSANTDYWIKIKFDGTQYTLDYSLDGKNYVNDILVTNSTKTVFPTVFNISNVFNSAVNGSIDLKQLSITVDGVEVFSGNRTGIDTIKPSDYQVVGAPTISADGIISDITTSNYVKTVLSKSFATANTWEIDTNINITSLSAVQRFYLVTSGVSNSLITQLGTNGKLYCYLSNTTTGDIANGEYLNYTASIGQKLKTRFLFTGTAYQFFINENKVWEKTSNIKVGGTTDLNVLTGGAFAPLLGSQDLNSFKVYVDGNLVYQPCLKIPYTLSKTGAKIVDSIYRDRVNDMAEQFGFAPYYTLGENDFTLPQVELYGLIGAKTLRDSYENGINKWYLYSNRDLEQQGSCTSGVEVTLAKPFADTNYVLSVPYSAKSATAFIPTQTGDWIAKGKGIL